MKEKNVDSKATTGMCLHGNFVGTCLDCKNARKNESLAVKFEEQFDTFTQSDLPKGFKKISEGIYSDNKKMAYKLYTEDFNQEYFVFSPEEIQIIPLELFGDKVSWEGNRKNKMLSWDETSEIINSEGWKAIGQLEDPESPFFVARPWRSLDDFKKVDGVEVGIYKNIAEDKPEYNMLIESGTLQAHVVEKFGEGVGVAFIDILRVPDERSGERTGRGLKDPGLDVKRRNPHIAKDQGSFKSQMKKILLQLKEMGISKLLAEPSDIRRGRIYSLFGFKLEDADRGILSAKLEDLLKVSKAV